MTDIPDQVTRQFARAIPARVRARLMKGVFETAAGDSALRRFVGMSQPGFARTLGISVHTLARIALLLLLNQAQPASASPGAATWYREVLLGENGSHAFVLTTTMINEGSYYRFRELQNLLRIDRRTGAVVDSILIRAVVIESDPSTFVRSLLEERMPSFDLPAYLRVHGTYSSFSQDPEDLAGLDSTGLYIQVGARREVLVSSSAIHARFLPSCEPDAVALLGADFTLAVPDSGLSRMTYYRVCSWPAGSDVPSSEVLIMVPDDQVDAIRRRAIVPRAHR